MRTLFVLIACVCCLALPVRGQYRSPIRCVYDSLVTAGDNSGNNPSKTLSVYLGLAALLSDSLPVRSLDYAIRGYRLAVEENDRNRKGQARMLLGDYYTKTQRLGLALENFLAGYQIFRAAGDTLSQAEALSKMAMVHLYCTQYSEAERFFLQAIKTARSIAADERTADLLTRLGAVCLLRKNGDSAMVCFRQAENIYEAYGNREGVLSVWNQMAGYYMDNKEYPKALLMLSEIEADSALVTDQMLGTVLTRMGHCYSEMGDHRASLAFNLKALKVRLRTLKEPDINSSLINIAGDYLHLGKSDSAMIYLNPGMEMAMRGKRWWALENSYNHLFRYYYAHNDFTNALTYAQKRAEMQKAIVLDNNSINLNLIRTSQRYASMVTSNALLEKANKMQELSMGMQIVQSRVVEVVTLLAAVSMVVLLFQFLYTRSVRRNMQHLNEKLNQEIRERNEAQRKTLLHEKQFRFIMNNSLDVISRVGRDFIHSFISPSSKEVLGYLPEEMVQIRPYELIHPDYRALTGQKIKEMIRTHRPVGMIYPAQRKDGAYQWVESILNPVFSHKTGEYQELVAVTRDIQNRKTKETEMMEGTKQKENLLKEIHHRVKNNFAILVSLINMQKGQTKNPEIIQSLTNLQLRIRSMSLVHEMLYRSADFERISFTDYLQSLASVIAGTYSRRDITLSIESDKAVIGIETSIPLGLIVNEVLSNAYKHAFPEGSAGAIQIRLIHSPGSDSLTLIFSDNGIGMPKGFNIEGCPTMGLQIVNILVHQIEGTLTIGGGPGTTISLTFPNTIGA